MIPSAIEEQSENERRVKILDQYLYSEEYQNKLKERLKINDAGMRSPEARKNIYYLCQQPNDPAAGCIFFIENFGWTASTKMHIKNLPFILFDFQKELIRKLVEHIDSGKDFFIEKSRDMGISWIVCCYVALWYWLFIEGSNGLLGSYKEKEVDNKVIDSLFGKLDYAIYNLPEWILPQGFKLAKHRTKLRLMNPANGNAITGDTMNPQFARGSRKTFVMFDELAFWDYAKDAWESAGESTNCRIAMSTPNGWDYYAMLRETGIDKITLHWRLHPLKDEQWYNYECRRKTEEEVAQELDISYNKSKAGRVYPEWNENNVLIGQYEYNENLPLYVGWDFGKSDDTAIIWAQPSREGLVIIDTYCNTGKNIDYYVPFITGMIDGDNTYHYKPDELEIISTRKNWKKATHFGDPAGRFSNQISDETVISVLKRYGIHVNFRDKWKEFKIRKHETKLLIMGRIFLNTNSRTKYFDTCIIQSVYPVVKVDGIGQIRSEKPRHDSSSHYRSSLEYMAIGISEHTDKVSIPFDKFPRKERVTRQWGRRSTGY